MDGTDAAFDNRRLAGVAEACRSATERLPSLFVALARYRQSHRSLLDQHTDLVIEGYPRSGNSYLASWVERANPELRIASHLHSIAHVRAALRRQVAVVVVLRPPLDAIASEILRGATAHVTQLLARYERFYVGTARHLDELILSPFSTTTTAPHRVVAALSERMQRNLSVTPPDGEDAVIADVEKRAMAVRGYLDEMNVGRPSARREEMAGRVREQLQSRYGSALERLASLHEDLERSPAAVR